MLYLRQNKQSKEGFKMSQLVQLRRQIKSIQATKKVTHAVRLTSMSMYSKLESRFANTQQYASHTQDFLTTLSQYSDSIKIPALLPNKPLEANPLIIVIASSRGFCGGFNSTLFRYMEKNFFAPEKTQPNFIAIGQKATKFFKDSCYGPCICNYNELNSQNFILIANDLVERILTQTPSYSSVIAFSNTPKNFFIQRPQKTTLVPIPWDKQNKQPNKTEETDEVNSIQNNTEGMPILEQTLPEIINYLAISYLKTSIAEILFKSLRAEYSARFLAMDSSTNNAEKILEQLILQFNKQRQALITREVSELAAGFSSNF
jgi:F-type H+-transporting ATPase subunit gamma